MNEKSVSKRKEKNMAGQDETTDQSTNQAINQQQEGIKLKNPKECFSLIKKKTFFVLNQLKLPDFKDGSEPLLFHHKKLSRFVFLIINEERKRAMANIPIKDMIPILEKTKILAQKQYEESLKKQDKKEASPAYTVTIGAGRLRGKTPASALAEDANNVQMLLNQVEWLKNNLSQYPKNQQQIDAINAALELFRSGQLNKDVASNRRTISVYESGIRFLKSQRLSLENASIYDGRDRILIYDVGIYWDLGSENPVRIILHNYYAPIQENDQKLVNVLPQYKDLATEVSNDFTFSLDEWIYAMHILESNIKTFENVYAGRCYKFALEEDERNRRKATMSKHREKVP